MNKNIKTAAKVAGLDRMVTIERKYGRETIETRKPLHEVVSTHTGRRTLVSILLNYFHIPATIVQKITAHSDLKELQKYINTSETDISRSLDNTQQI